MKCRVCGQDNPRRFYALKKFPLVAGPVSRVNERVKTIDLELGRCSNCGTVSLLNEEAEKIPYDANYTSSNIPFGHSRSMDKTTQGFLSFIEVAKKERGAKVLEIGCYDGILMGLMKELYGFNIVGCEPCTEVAEIARRRGNDVRACEFSGDDYRNLDMVIARNVLEHIARPLPFLRDITRVLSDNGVFILEVPDGDHCISRGIIGTIVPEHPCYYSEENLRLLLLQYFRDVQVYYEGIILRAAAREPKRGVNGWLGGFYAGSMGLPRLLRGRMVREWRYGEIRRNVNGREVGLFGANTCALELLASGCIKESQIMGIFDDDPRKWGKYLINTELQVSPRQWLEKVDCREFIICSFTHRKIIAEYMRSQGKKPIMLYEDEE